MSTQTAPRTDLRTSCKWGHEYTPENTIYRHENGRTWRRCRQCKRDRKRAPSPRNDYTVTVGIHDDGTADVSCWCEWAVVRVPLADIRAGRTGSCERCEP